MREASHDSRSQPADSGLLAKQCTRQRDQLETVTLNPLSKRLHYLVDLV
ncbi:MAG: hypothetical protein KME43_19695 [Myxacorys chilensis ATA2-1-KO14]|nr:hypothetical protein [Myxacorys chilensis ATA2-1-KO14]